MKRSNEHHAPPHRPWFKVLINTALRFVQTRRRPARLFVLASLFEGDRLVGYTFARVLHCAEDQRPQT